MEQTYAIIQNGQVLNIIVWDGQTEYEIPNGCIIILAGPGAEPGGTYDGKNFIPVPKGQ